MNYPSILPSLPKATRFSVATGSFIICLAASTASWADATYEEAFEFEREIAGERVEIKHEHGNIAIHGWDQPGLKISGEKIVRARNLETAENYAQSVNVEISQGGGEIRVETVRPKKSKAWQIRRDQVNYELYLPRALLVELESEHGSVMVTDFANGVSVEGEHGRLSVESIGEFVEVEHEHGDVSIAGIDGAVEVKTEHGKLNIQAVSGLLELEHEHGNATLDGIDGEVEAKVEHSGLTISDVRGSLDLKHEHGRVSLAGIQGNLRVNKDHGSLAVEGIEGGIDAKVEHANTRIHTAEGASAHYEIEGEHSNIKLVLARADEARYSLKADKGRIVTSLPINIVKGKDWQAATSQHGAPNVVVSTDHGDISIE